MTDVKVFFPIDRTEDHSAQRRGSSRSTEYASSPGSIKKQIFSESDDSADEFDCTCGSLEAKLKEVFDFKVKGSMTLEEANSRIAYLSAEIEKILAANVKLVKKIQLLQQMGGAAERIKELEMQIAVLIESNNKYAAMIEEYKAQAANFQA